MQHEQFRLKNFSRSVTQQTSTGFETVLETVQKEVKYVQS